MISLSPDKKAHLLWSHVEIKKMPEGNCFTESNSYADVIIYSFILILETTELEL